MPHATASFNGKVIAETDTWENVDGNIYVRIGECGLMLDVDADNRKFPPNSIDQSVLTKTDTHTSCPWKGKAHYYSISVDGMLLLFHPFPG